MVDKILNCAVVVRHVLLAAVDMVVPEVAFVEGVVSEVVLVDNSLDMVVPEVAFAGSVVSELVCSIFVGPAIGDNLGHYIG